jgi:eukaryotic-like serine/threonine-protein kinase
MNADALGPGAEVSDPSVEASSSAVDDPRVAAALDEYLAGIQAGQRPSRQEFLGRHPEIADALERGLDVLEFLHSTAELPAPSVPPRPDHDSLPPETILGDYCLIREVGRGGMGVVYEARQISLGRRVAVKVLAGAGVVDPRRLERFRIEAQAVAQLNHAHIVPIFAVGFDRGIHYYAMQYIEGCTLADVLESHPRRDPQSADLSTRTPSRPPVPDHSRNGTCPAPTLGQSAGVAPIPSHDAFRAVAQLGIQAAEALDHAHAMGVLHRDIKPSNLLIDSHGGLWITDFGLARFRDDSGLTLTGDLVGTLRYMAPELAMGGRMSFDPRSDIYALGATLYELLTLRPVFDGQDRRELFRQITQDEPVSPRRIDRAIPRDLETIVMKAMDKEPERRYTAASELAEDLRRFLTDQPILARPLSPWERAARWGRRHRVVLMTVASVVLVALGVGSVLLGQEQQKTAKAKDNFGESFRLLTLADDLTIRGMGRMAATSRTTEEKADLADFYRQALVFYERMTREPSIPLRTQALAFRHLGFTRMVSTNDSRAADDFQLAIAIYEKLLADEPGDAEAADGLADVHFHLGIWLMSKPERGGMSAAVAAFHRAIDIAEQRAVEAPMEAGLLDDVVSKRLQVSEWMELQNMMSEAEAERRALFDLYARVTAVVSTATPGDDRSIMAGWAANAYRSLAQQLVLGRRGWIREQEEALRLGLEFQPDGPELLHDLAGLLTFRQDADQATLRRAVELAQRAAETAPARPDNWRVLALSHLHADDWRRAADAVDRSLKLQGDKGQASDRLLLAMVSWQQGHRKEAHDWYVRALARMAHSRHDDPEASRYWPEARQMLKPVLEADGLTVDSQP